MSAITHRLAGLGARVTRRAADAALSDGRDPGASAVLAARARQLTSPRARRRTALALERLALTAAGHPLRTWVAPSRAAVTANREALLELAAVLRACRPVYAGGVATLELVLRDGSGPVYTDRRGEGLAAELACARGQLDGG